MGKTIVRRDDTEPILPAWTRDRAVAKAYAANLARRTGRGSIRAAAQAPAWAFRHVGITGKGFLIIAGTWHRWVTAAELREAIESAAKTSGVIDSKAQERRHDRITKRWRTTWIAAAILAGTLFTLFMLFGWTPLLLSLLAVITTAEIVGWQSSKSASADADQPSALPESPIGVGMPIRQLGESINEALASMKFPKARVSRLFVAPDGRGWLGEVSSPSKPLTDDVARILESMIMAPVDSVSFSVDPANAAAYKLRIELEDPLGMTLPAPEMAHRSLSVLQPLECGVGRNGKTLRINFLRSHTAIVGRTRSGKSSALWQIINALSACIDTAMVSIDLTNGPAFPSWRGVIQRKAVTNDQATELLTDLIAEAQRRTDILAEQAESDEDDIDEVWNPTPEDPQIVCLIDEYSILAEDQGLLNLVKLLARTAAKAAVILILSTQEANKDAFGSVAVRNGMLNKIMFGCSAADIALLMTREAVSQGWRPDRLKSAQGDDPGDSGKSFVWTVDHREPDLWKWFRLTLPEVRRIARSREEHIVPINLARNTIAVPPILAVMAEAFGHYDCDGLPSQQIVEFARENEPDFSDLTQSKLADLLRPLSVSPAQLGTTQFGPNKRGYRRVDVTRALEIY